MTYEEHLREAYNEGAREVSLKIARKLLKSGKNEIEISEIVDLPLEEIQKIITELLEETFSEVDDDDYDFIAVEVIPETDDEPFNLKVRETMEEVHRLGRPLTDEEMEKFKY